MPLWCDMTCPEADWPKDDALDGSGSCRTFLAVHCNKYKRIHTKNAPCLEKILADQEPVKIAKKGVARKNSVKNKGRQ